MNTNTDFDKIDKVLSKITGKELKSFVRELLIQSDEIEEDSRLGILGDIVKRCDEIGDNYFMRFEWFVDEAMPLLCGDDEKAYFAHISKRLKNRKEKYFHYRYYIQKADYWIVHGKRNKAEKLMMDRRDDENIRSHYIECLIEWKEYRKAIEIIDDNKNDFKAQYNKWEDKAVQALKLSGDKEWMIEECRKRIITSGYKLKYYEALKEAVPKEEWNEFLNQLWEEVTWEEVIKDGIKKLIAEYPDKYYMKSYLGSVL